LIRTSCWVAALALGLWACGGNIVVVADGGLKDKSHGQDAPPEAPFLGYCLYESCAGISSCDVGKTCPIGDGCNSCSCALGPAGMALVTCTLEKCSCP
jgi:hypothetical protein